MPYKLNAPFGEGCFLHLPQKRIVSKTATATSNYIGEAMRATATLAPPSLADNPGLLAWNLFVMTAAFCLGLMMAGRQARRLWRTRDIDHPKDPVSIYRIIVFLAGCAIASRGGAEAVSLWSWSSEMY